MGSQKPVTAFDFSVIEDYVPLTLIIGGGIAGLICAEKLSKEKIPSILVEKEEALGGQLRSVSSFYHTEVKPQDLLAEKKHKVENNPYVTIYKKTIVKTVTGLAGNFLAEIEGPERKESIKVGSIVFASGNKSINKWPVDKNNLAPEKQNGSVTLMQLEEMVGELRNDSPKKTIAIMIEEDDFLISPGVALKNANILKEAGHDVYYFYDEMKINEEHLEPIYHECRKKGVIFIRNAKESIKLQSSGNKIDIEFKDPFTPSNLQNLSLECDILVFNESIVPCDETINLAKQMNITRHPADGFLQEDNYHLLPVGTNKLGVYAIGACRKPDFLWNIISEAEAAAENIYRTLLTYKDWVKERPVVLGPNDCIVCLTCLRTCPRDAIYIDPKGGQCQIHRPACEGCGMCVAECPNVAIRYPEGLNLREQIGPEGRERL